MEKGKVLLSVLHSNVLMLASPLPMCVCFLLDISRKSAHIGLQNTEDDHYCEGLRREIGCPSVYVRYTVCFLQLATILQLHYNACIKGTILSPEIIGTGGAAELASMVSGVYIFFNLCDSSSSSNFIGKPNTEVLLRLETAKYLYYKNCYNALGILLIAIIIAEISFYLVQSLSCFKFRAVTQPNE